MTVIVVAVLEARPGCGERVVQNFRIISPKVHQETGCELYALHREQSGDTVVMVERWATRADLDAHADGEPLRELNELNDGLLTKPYDVWFLDAVALGDERKGTIPHL